jgi:AcrR family transcriptional regulator
MLKRRITMPTKTFFNLSQDKQVRVDLILLNNFYQTHISEIKVSAMLAGTGISRTSFYKYFESMEDAYTYTMHQAFSKTHHQILAMVLQNQKGFFTGISEYLRWCSHLKPTSVDFKQMNLLINGEDASIHRHQLVPAKLPYMEQWLALLTTSGFNIKDPNEALSFMYFIMDLVIDTLKAFAVNQWTTEQLLQDFQYKTKWIQDGIR